MIWKVCNQNKRQILFGCIFLFFLESHLLVNIWLSEDYLKKPLVSQQRAQVWCYLACTVETLDTKWSKRNQINTSYKRNQFILFVFPGPRDSVGVAMINFDFVRPWTWILSVTTWGGGVCLRPLCCHKDNSLNNTDTYQVTLQKFDRQKAGWLPLWTFS